MGGKKYPFSEKRLKNRLKRKLRKNKNYVRNIRATIRRWTKQLKLKW